LMTVATRERPRRRARARMMMTTTFITPDRPIERAANDDAGRVPRPYARGQAAGVPDDRGSAVHARWGTRREGRDRLQAPGRGASGRCSDASFTKPSATVNSDDDRVKALAAEGRRKHRAAPTRPRPRPSASSLHGFITEKDLG
jgi:hypothetical protein